MEAGPVAGRVVGGWPACSGSAARTSRAVMVLAMMPPEEKACCCKVECVVIVPWRSAGR